MLVSIMLIASLAQAGSDDNNETDAVKMDGDPVLVQGRVGPLTLEDFASSLVEEPESAAPEWDGLVEIAGLVGGVSQRDYAVRDAFGPVLGIGGAFGAWRGPEIFSLYINYGSQFQTTDPDAETDERARIKFTTIGVNWFRHFATGANGNELWCAIFAEHLSHSTNGPLKSSGLATGLQLRVMTSSGQKHQLAIDMKAAMGMEFVGIAGDRDQSPIFYFQMGPRLGRRI